MTAHRSDCSKHGYDDERGHKDVDPDAPCDCGVEALERAIAKIDVDTMIAEKLAALSAVPAPPAGEGQRVEDYRSGYSAGWADGKNGEPMQDSAKAALFFVRRNE